jgi:hypothetical protein
LPRYTVSIVPAGNGQPGEQSQRTANPIAQAFNAGSGASNESKHLSDQGWVKSNLGFLIVTDTVAIDSIITSDIANLPKFDELRLDPAACD